MNGNGLAAGGGAWYSINGNNATPLFQHNQTCMTTDYVTPRKSRARAIVEAGLLAGTLDAIAASLQFFIVTGKSPVIVWQYVASAVFGSATAYSGNPLMIVLGLLFHFTVAMGWAILLFTIYPRIYAWLSNRILIGVIYAIFVWTVMNFVVVPLTRVPPMPFRWTGAMVAASILVVAIGIPLSWLAHRYYYKNRD